MTTMKNRLDKLVAEQFQLSRRGAREAILRGQIDVAGERRLDPADEVEAGEEVSYNPNRPRPEVAARNLRVLYEDRDILIIDKPTGLLCQPTQARERDTLLERAGRYLARKRGVDRPYVGVVHRIDQQTSGVILVVISPRALRPFQNLFRTHTIERSYLAVVEGVFLTPSGRIDLALVGDAGDGRRGTAREPGEGTPATTHFQVVESYGRTASLVALRLETGRTHQIRIHLAAIGHPVVGDAVYGRRGRPTFPIRFPRQALHAEALGFIHPLSGQPIRVESPLPADYVALIDDLKHKFGVTRIASAD
jgi:23S rRNA pseudouridine1911/1915/1917 synthase